MRKEIKNAKRIIVKVGTSTLIYPNGNINLAAIDQLAFVISDLRNRGKEVILVSSGAVGVGMHKLHLSERPTLIPEQQAAAAVGQAELMNIYNQRFSVYNQQTAQILVTRDVVDYPESRKNVRNTLEQLLIMDTIPIVNENDTVAVDELDHLTKFGDNDQLSAIMAKLVAADLLIVLSDIDGFYSDNPTTNPEAQMYRYIDKIDEKILAQAGGAGSTFGTGGMQSKLKAASRIFEANSAMILANGKNPAIIFDILAGKEVGTLFKEDLK
ncbi:glutamate 5-kinase [Enterococcus faecium]|uniref:glutamate 5-kinase n=1 Tax=Enterococcus faecium TaxID=1352 RepID=UPI000DE863C5|nr:glutamate 5-kinase [Enterococcus faecium]RBS45382.1 glutamate 5-kinase [Enterococcus faecium]